MVVGADCRPCSFGQFWLWMQRYMKGGEKFHMIGLAAICWAIWRSRNNACFEKRIIRSPTEVICLASTFISFWAELQHQGGDRATLKAGAEALVYGAEPASRCRGGRAWDDSSVTGRPQHRASSAFGGSSFGACSGEFSFSVSRYGGCRLSY